MGSVAQSFQTKADRGQRALDSLIEIQGKYNRNNFASSLTNEDRKTIMASYYSLLGNNAIGLSFNETQLTTDFEALSAAIQSATTQINALSETAKQYVI